MVTYWLWYQRAAKQFSINALRAAQPPRPRFHSNFRLVQERMTDPRLIPAKDKVSVR